MAKEKIENISTPILLKRKKFVVFLTGLFIGILIVWSGLIIYDIIVEGKTETSTIYGSMGTLACFWIPLFMLKKVNAELKRRGDK